MVVKTNYRKSGAKKLVKYIKSHGKLYDRAGREIDKAKDFIERSNELNFTRQIILSPPNGNEMTDRDLSIYARQQLEEQFDGSSVDYVFAIHRDTAHHHVITALIGERRDLYLDREDLEKMREMEKEILKELGYEREAERYRYLQRDYSMGL